MSREVKRYYLEAPEEEINSDIAPKTFDIWGIMDDYGKKLKLGNRLLDVGLGTGRFTLQAFKKGYDVMAIDLLPEFIARVTRKHPELKKRLHVVNLLDEKSVLKFVEEYGQFDIVTALGVVANHAQNKHGMTKILYNIVKFAGTNSLLVVDLLLEEMFPGKPQIIWSDFTHTLTSLTEMGQIFQKYGFTLLDAYTIHETYPAKGELFPEFNEHSIRIFIHKPW
ncbi:MAG: methyltransferase domain-containing protein [Candidatus Freyarchaeota archaeon]|nr:methyltransferase domain-containing protein [Candidatus Jordarchaeia archaeon]MBS7269319.1 methyltransferase domain-containing protein [Candidatus Jordarchaeia archaeon]MBS7281110.1 methyltransferase domain-containing protein [Candidatus Jordarchaeia archaeon]